MPSTKISLQTYWNRHAENKMVEKRCIVQRLIRESRGGYINNRLGGLHSNKQKTLHKSNMPIH